MNGQRLKDIRAACGMTQEQLAKVCGMNHITICKWETDETANPRMMQFSKVAKALGMKPHELLKELES